MAYRRLRVFVSSKQIELDDERQIAREVIESFESDPIMSENRAASPNPPLDICLQEVELADIYIGIFYREHSQPTEAEYRRATELHIPCLIFIKRIRENEQREEALNILLEEIRNPTRGQWTNDFDNVIELRDKIKVSLLRLLIGGFHESRARNRGGNA